MPEGIHEIKLKKVIDIVITTLVNSSFWIEPKTERGNKYLNYWLDKNLLKNILNELLVNKRAAVYRDEHNNLLISDKEKPNSLLMECSSLRFSSTDQAKGILNIPIELLSSQKAREYTGLEVRTKLFRFHGMIQGLIRSFQRVISKDIEYLGISHEFVFYDKAYIDLLLSFLQNNIVFEKWIEEEIIILNKAYAANLIKKEEYEKRILKYTRSEINHANHTR
ncbi:MULTISPECIES: hypothetical protein [Geobacillus]|uniref:Uncharacterized protein n=1 Tax=Geobacillus stearothermophilus TaxID=1422 RepID=A0A916NWC8_GEOSE|nr:MULTISPECIES: hypothetical protein [Geobacillus]KZM56290.1 hypothetical protein A3Q36_06000 [Geobacillus stearothermophilus]TWG24959.1 hypothetical protein GC56T2_3549 [Geobacillus sp. C56-T2]CAP08232.1 hypothetical protein pGS18_ORF21 [Geobacillus stearothermophilus]